MSSQTELPGVWKDGQTAFSRLYFIDCISFPVPAAVAASAKKIMLYHRCIELNLRADTQ